MLGWSALLVRGSATGAQAAARPVAAPPRTDPTVAACEPSSVVSCHRVPGPDPLSLPSSSPWSTRSAFCLLRSWSICRSSCRSWVRVRIRAAAISANLHGEDGTVIWDMLTPGYPPARTSAVVSSPGCCWTTLAAVMVLASCRQSQWADVGLAVAGRPGAGPDRRRRRRHRADFWCSPVPMTDPQSAAATSWRTAPTHPGAAHAGAGRRHRGPRRLTVRYGPDWAGRRVGLVTGILLAAARRSGRRAPGSDRPDLLATMRASTSARATLSGDVDWDQITASLGGSDLGESRLGIDEASPARRAVIYVVLHRLLGSAGRPGRRAGLPDTATPARLLVAGPPRPRGAALTRSRHHGRARPGSHRRRLPPAAGVPSGEPPGHGGPGRPRSGGDPPTREGGRARPTDRTERARPPWWPSPFRVLERHQVMGSSRTP